MTKLIDERIEHLSWEIKDLNAEISAQIAELKREFLCPTIAISFAYGGGLLDALLAKRTAKEEELKALRAMLAEKGERA